MIDTTKTWYTRGGLPVTFLSTEGRGSFPIVGYIGPSNVPTGWTEDGRIYDADNPDIDDLVSNPPPDDLICWVNFYDDGGFIALANEGLADDVAAYYSAKYGAKRVGTAVKVVPKGET